MTLKEARDKIHDLTERRMLFLKRRAAGELVGKLRADSAGTPSGARRGPHLGFPDTPRGDPGGRTRDRAPPAARRARGRPDRVPPPCVGRRGCPACVRRAAAGTAGDEAIRLLSVIASRTNGRRCCSGGGGGRGGMGGENRGSRDERHGITPQPGQSGYTTWLNAQKRAEAVVAEH